ncbi:MAG TPA: nidogen-like domain-containing protein [Solirubrobacteraceae bacterium]|nr:nidogen-like domain-containing protein [Solirubrobacteraceae bacterium]
MLRARLVVLTLLAALAAAAPASAAPGVVQDLPGCRTAQLPANDDDSTEAVPLGFTATMFDRTFSEVFVNNNGNVTVNGALSEFTPFDFRETGDPIIAPFFADVDTSGDASGLVNYGQVADYGGHKAFCVIWDHVGYYNGHDDKTNTFQLIIVDRGVDGIDIVANYDSITWETGDASDGTNGFGGVSAVAGYAAGDGDAMHALIAPGSFANGGLLDSNPSTSLAGHSTAGQPAGQYVFPLRQAAPTGARLTGIVTTPFGDPASGALVQACRSGSGGACVSRIAGSDGHYTASNLPAGMYTVTAFPGPGPAYASATATGVALAGPGTTTPKDLQLGELPPPPPAGTTITNIGTTGDDIPVAYWGDPLTLVTQGCTGGTAAYQVVLEGRNVRSGPMTESPAGSGRFTATIAPLQPDHGDGLIRITFTCPGAPVDPVEFGIYIDPSGVVKDQNGNPVQGATVRLFRSASASGPFFPVPDGSAIMSPSNRINPDETDAAGRFGWDVVAGFYKVTAAKEDCVSAADPSQAAATTGVLTIPPPVTDLDLRLKCTPPAGNPGGGGGGGTTPPVVTPVSPPATTTTTPPRKLATVGKVTLRKGKVLVVAVSCAKTARTACAGAVTAKLGKKVIAKRSYKGLKAGRTSSLQVKLSKAGRKLVARVKRGKKLKIALTVTVRDAAGTGATAKRTVTVRR